MPASPESNTIWPAPAQASRRRSRNRALSAARPTRSVSPRRARPRTGFRLRRSPRPRRLRPARRSPSPSGDRGRAAGTGRRSGGGSRRRGRSVRVAQALASAPRGWGLADHRLLLRRALANQIADHDQPGGNADADGERHRSTGLQTRHRRLYLASHWTAGDWRTLLRFSSA